MIYLQSDSDKKLPHHFDVACAMYGAIDTAQSYKFVTFEEVESGRFDNLIRNNLFVGSVEFMNMVFSRIGLSDVRLPENSNREFETITLKQAKDRSKSGEKLFIKPFDIKLFTGFVIDESIYTSISNIPDDTKVMAYKPFYSPIESEWRCYIYRDKVIDIRNYSGNIFTFPDEIELLEVVYKNEDKFPTAYTIDVGILESGENVVIEYNDMWAIGNYGMDNETYLKLLRSRYFEIVSNELRKSYQC